MALPSCPVLLLHAHALAKRALHKIFSIKWLCVHSCRVYLRHFLQAVKDALYKGLLCPHIIVVPAVVVVVVIVVFDSNV